MCVIDTINEQSLNADCNTELCDSKYVSTSDLEMETHDTMKVMHYNIRGFVSKQDEFKMILENLEQKDIFFDIISINETWLNTVNERLVDMAPYLVVCKNRIDKKGGGLAVLLKSNIRYKRRVDLEFDVDGMLETLCLDIVTHDKSFILLNMYRRPNTSETIFIEKLNDFLANVNGKNLIICTDQNIDLLKTASRTNSSQFLNSIIDVGLIPTITKPSRVTHSTATLIDNIYVRSSMGVDVNSYLLLEDLSDHYPCICTLPITNKKYKESLIKFGRRINDKKTEKLRVDLASQPILSPTTDVNIMVGEFYSKLNKSLDTTMPKEKIVISAKKRLNQPWMTPGLLKSSQLLKKKYNLSIKKSNDSLELKDYKQYRKTFNKLKRSTKRMFYFDKLTKFKKNSRTLWSIMNQLIGKHNNRHQGI